MILFFRVQGRSMEPYCKEGDFVFVNKFIGLKEGDVAVIRHPISSRFLLKRVIKKIDKKYWLKGDNKEESLDSRVFGWVNKDSVLGLAKVIHK
ncbi:MAG: nickel-type superoxide dismutase maturation protease [Patescibacteria group bacterium]|nr:nickel-type superoxide dismutase maturation protease [Patescibacteria group bacterium]